MKARHWPGMLAVALVLLLTLAVCGCPKPKERAPEPGVIVLAASSLTEAFTAFEPYAERQMGIDVKISFGGSQALRTSIEQGNAADVFASANMEHIEALQKANLLSDAFEFAHNKLALIVPKDNPAKIESLADLGSGKVRLVVAVEDCPAGKYTRKLLAACDKDPAFGAGFSKRVLTNVASEDADVKQVLSKVTLGAANVAFVYDSDITKEVQGQVKQIPIPASVQQTVTYGVGIPATAKNPEGGRKFIELLLSEGGQAAIAEAAIIEFIPSAKPPWTAN
ncbi:MAG: molybdate ABC transporter substrate-binding protein [Armatimonadetes bacterium]|nr:molybdate ABC transporter substrate-binding protein [Armatimonadota bacterium]